MASHKGARMRLLVSVRSVNEVSAAVAGGVGIVDAKEPARGPLGAVDPAELRNISRALPVGTPLSVALGDPADGHALVSAWRLLDALAPDRPVFVKVGLAQMRGVADARALLVRAVALAAASPLRPSLVAVAYADAVGPPPDAVTALAAEAGAQGVLLDTARKDGRDLFSFVSEPVLHAWATGARGNHLLVAVAGSLSLAGVGRAARLPIDVVGVRGAACIGGREGQVDSGRVHSLAVTLSGAATRPEAVA